MRRYFYLALLVLLCLGVAYVVACGGGKSTTNKSYLTDDDTSVDDDTTSDDDTNADDDNAGDDNAVDDNADDDNADDDSASCSSSIYTQCTGSAWTDYTSCTANCSGTGCQADNCQWNCDLQWDTAFIACDTNNSCETELTRTQCWETCNQAAINCLKPLITCNSTRADGCDSTWNTCIGQCPS